MPYITVFNTTDRPVPIDDEGRSLPGGEWGPVLTTADQVQAALDAGHLVKVDTPAKDANVNPAAAAAFAATAELEKARKKGPDELADVAAVQAATPTRAAARAATNEEG